MQSVKLVVVVLVVESGIWATAYITINPNILTMVKIRNIKINQQY